MTTGRDDAVQASAVVRAAEAQLPWARARLAEYVRMESPSGDAARLNELAGVLADAHAALGATVTRVPGVAGDHLVSRWSPDGGGDGDGGRPLVVLGHHDTVWPVGTLQRMPFTDDGQVAAGPGTFDMKGGLLALEMAHRALATVGVALAQPVHLVVVSDEEVGTPDGRALVEREFRGAGAVVGLEPAHPDGRLKTARMGSVTLRVEVTGRAAHAALDPEAGVSAIDELVDQLTTVRGIVGRPGVLANVGVLAGGGRTNVVAAAAHADLGLRFGDPAVEREVLGAVTALEPRRAGAEVSVKTLSARPVWPATGQSAEQTALLDWVAALGRRIGQEIGGAPAAGGGDTNFAGALGLPTLDGFGPAGAGAHATHEHIRVASLPERAALLALMFATPLPPADGQA